MSEVKKLSREDSDKLPIKVLQFGEGNFLRAFVEYAFDVLNKELDFNAGIAVVQPIENGMVEMLEEQDGLYTLFLQGIVDGKATRNKELIENIVRLENPYKNFEDYISLARIESLEFVISNTTEAGIAFNSGDSSDMRPASSFPGKLTQLLYERFRHFKGDPAAGLTIIPCELINHNSDTLQKIILKYISHWKLGSEFEQWVIESCAFHNTLVDRIVPGYPKDRIDEYEAELDYKDNLIVCAETYFLWVIEGGEPLKEKLPFHKTALNVKIVKDMQPYRTRKVRILNGSHTAMVPFSLLYGNSTVKETIDNGFTGDFIRSLVYEEIVPVLDFDDNEIIEFASDVFDRFRNPYIVHMLSSIALNSVSKYKVRVLPSLLEYVEQKNELPVRLVYSLACLILFYQGKWAGKPMPVADEEEVVEALKSAWQMEHTEETVMAVLENERLWSQNLDQVPMLSEAVTMALEEIEKHDVEKGFALYAEKMEVVNKKMADHVG